MTNIHRQQQININTSKETRAFGKINTTKHLQTTEKLPGLYTSSHTLRSQFSLNRRHPPLNFNEHRKKKTACMEIWTERSFQ